jgi:hypothetical protein
MSHVAGEEAELIEATGATETQGQPHNGRRTTASFMARAERERERARVLGWGCNWAGEGGECGWDPKKARARGGVARKCAVVGASTAESAGGSGGRFRQAGPTEQRERRANGWSALTRGAHRIEREEGTRDGSWRRQLGPTG